MKQEEKAKLTKERIIQAAIQEFGANGYISSSLNTICNDYGISKGLLYYYFSGKDDLYLTCVSRCFSSMTEYLEEKNIRDDLEKYIHMRFQYFSEYPDYAGIFFEAVLKPPASLAEPIRELRKELDALNHKIFRAVLANVTLREGITEADAMQYCEIMQEMFNGYFSSLAYASKDIQSLMIQHEDWLPKMLNLMLYGIGKRRI